MLQMRSRIFHPKRRCRVTGSETRSPARSTFTGGNVRSRARVGSGAEPGRLREAADVRFRAERRVGGAAEGAGADDAQTANFERATPPRL